MKFKKGITITLNQHQYLFFIMNFLCGKSSHYVIIIIKVMFILLIE